MEETKDLMKGHRTIFWILVCFSVANTFFMMNINANGLDALPQIIVQLPMLLIGIVLFIINTIRGFKYALGSGEVRRQKGWKQSDDMWFYLSPCIPIYNVLIMWFLAR